MRPGTIIAAADHLALANGLYYIGALVMVEQCAGWAAPAPPVSHRAASYAFVACLAVSTYLLDRVKPTGRFLDEADPLAHPARSDFMRRHARPVRAAVLLLGAAAGVSGALVSWMAPLVVVTAWGGVLFYARPRELGWRPKDTLVVKNLAVAVAASALCAFAAIMTRPSLVTSVNGLTALAVAGASLVLIVFGDAAVCDIDDVPGDAPFGTRTFPVVAGAAPTWRIADAVHLAAALTMTAGAAAGVTSYLPTLVFGWAMLLSNMLLRDASPRRVRPWVDLRLGLFGALALALGA